jgi:DNA repair protein RadC
LLAILFRSGTREKGAVALAQDLVTQFGDLRRLAQASLEELQQVRGIGRVKAIEIKAAIELGLRLAEFSRKKVRLRNGAEVAEHMMTRLKDLETEQFWCIAMDVKNQVIRDMEISRGGMDGTIVEPRGLFREALRAGAASVIVVHNHPSGDPEPSRMDLDLTARLVAAGNLLGVSLIDHVIVGDGRTVSLKERGLL